MKAAEAKLRKAKVAQEAPPMAPPAPPPPAMVVSAPSTVCAVDTLNGLLNALMQARDILVGIETLENLDSNVPIIDMRERVQKRVTELATSLQQWRAHE